MGKESTGKGGKENCKMDCFTAYAFLISQFPLNLRMHFSLKKSDVSKEQVTLLLIHRLKNFIQCLLLL